MADNETHSSTETLKRMLDYGGYDPTSEEHRKRVVRSAQFLGRLISKSGKPYGFMDNEAGQELHVDAWPLSREERTVGGVTYRRSVYSRPMSPELLTVRCSRDDRPGASNGMTLLEDFVRASDGGRSLMGEYDIPNDELTTEAVAAMVVDAAANYGLTDAMISHILNPDKREIG